MTKNTQGSSGLCVGARVRIIYSINWPELAGQCGTILDACEPDEDGDGEWIVAPDSWGGAHAPEHTGVSDEFSMFAPMSQQLEPIERAPHSPCGKSLEALLGELSCWQGSRGRARKPIIQFPSPALA